jgi:hypothetical protein
MMKNYFFRFLAIFIGILFVTVPISYVYADEPSGAKSIFGSGEGPVIKTFSEPSKTTPKKAKSYKQETEKYVGISYKLALIGEDGRMEIVPKSRIFKSGERMRILVTTNQPGYLTVLNVGPTGNTSVLFKEYVKGFNPYTIPFQTNLVFTGAPGTERILMTLSDDQSFDTPPIRVASLDGAKDIVPEDSLESRYAVLSPENGWRPVNGSKDIALESDNGTNYGVVPASAIQGRNALSLEIKLKHR